MKVRGGILLGVNTGRGPSDSKFWSSDRNWTLLNINEYLTIK
jgi:hypothetical protein